MVSSGTRPAEPHLAAAPLVRQGQVDGFGTIVGQVAQQLPVGPDRHADDDGADPSNPNATIQLDWQCVVEKLFHTIQVISRNVIRQQF